MGISNWDMIIRKDYIKTIQMPEWDLSKREIPQGHINRGGIAQNAPSKQHDILVLSFIRKPGVRMLRDYTWDFTATPHPWIPRTTFMLRNPQRC